MILNQWFYWWSPLYLFLNLFIVCMSRSFKPYYFANHHDVSFLIIRSRSLESLYVTWKPIHTAQRACQDSKMPDKKKKTRGFSSFSATIVILIMTEKNRKCCSSLIPPRLELFWAIQTGRNCLLYAAVSAHFLIRMLAKNTWHKKKF